MAKSTTDNIIDTGAEWYAKLPNLPKGGRDALVSIMPWVAIIGGVVGVVLAIAGLGILTAFAPLALMVDGGAGIGGGMVHAVILLAASVLLIMAYPGVKSHKEKGWRLLFWSEAVYLISAVISFNLGSVLGSLIGFYIVYQIRSYYK